MINSFYLHSQHLLFYVLQLVGDDPAFVYGIAYESCFDRIADQIQFSDFVFQFRIQLVVRIEAAAYYYTVRLDCSNIPVRVRRSNAFFGDFFQRQTKVDVDFILHQHVECAADLGRLPCLSKRALGNSYRAFGCRRFRDYRSFGLRIPYSNILVCV